MEFCPSGDLSKWFWNNQNLNFYEKTIKTISTKLLIALRAMHLSGVIHCNLKPTNIILDEYGNVKICDFKKALKVNEMTIEDIKKNKSAMTPCYTAPELFSDDGAYSFKSDLWALGCIMYEMAVGRVPFLDEAVNRLIEKILHEEPKIGSKEFKSYSDEFVDVVKKLLEKDPNNRPGWGEIEKMPFWELSSEDTSPILTTSNKERPSSVSNITNSNIDLITSSGHSKALSITNPSTVIAPQPINIEVNDNDEEEDDDYSSSQKGIKDVGSTDQEFNFKNRPSSSSVSNTNCNTQPINNKLEFSVLNASKIIKRDKRVSLTTYNEMELSLAKNDDQPNIQSIMIHTSDRMVKPLIGNKIIEPNQSPPLYEVSKLPFKSVYKLDLIKEMLINGHIDELEKYLLTIYQSMDVFASKKDYVSLLNILNYFETIILSKDMANNIVNTSFVKLLISFMDINNDSIRIRACSIIGYLIRYSTNIESSFDKYNLTEKLISFISDGNLLLNRKSIATLGEYVFFVSTQVEGEEIPLDENDNSKWEITTEAIIALVYALNHSDEVVKFTALKTIENIVTLTSIGKNYFAQDDDCLLKAIEIYTELSENKDIKTSALSTISHLIRHGPSMLKIFFDKVIDYKELIDSETSKNKQCLINIILFAIAGDRSNIKYLDIDSLMSSLIFCLENENSVIRSKIILLLALVFGDNSLVGKYGDKIFGIMQRLRKEKQNYYFFVKIFESYMIAYCKSLAMQFIKLISNQKENLNEIAAVLSSISIIGPYHKISYILNTKDFIETLLKLIRSSSNEDIISSAFDIIKSFSENTYSVEQNTDYLVTKFISALLNMTSSLNEEYKRFPLNICANILSILLDDDKVYSSVAIEGGKTNLINTTIITILPIVYDLLKSEDTVSNSLSFLSLIIERNSAFISYYKSIGIIEHIFKLMMDNKYYSNLNLIKIMIKLIEANDTKFCDIISMNLIDKVNYMISKDTVDDITIYTEYIIEMLFDLMFKLNEYKKIKFSKNLDKNEYRSNFISKISKIAVNFKLCIKYLSCDNINIQEKSCVCLIFMLQFFPDGYVDCVDVKFSTEDIPELLKGLDSSCVKIHKKIIKIFKWIIEYQNDAQNVLGLFVPYIQIYVEKVMDSSKEIDVIDTAKKFLSVDLKRINNTSK